jgi:hypothetical protein
LKVLSLKILLYLFMDPTQAPGPLLLKLQGVLTKTISVRIIE